MMASISSFKTLIKDIHEKIEREGAALKSDLRELKNVKVDDKRCEHVNEHLDNLKECRAALEDITKYLTDTKTQIYDTEVSLHEAAKVAVEHRATAGRTLRTNNDSGCFSVDSKVLEERDKRTLSTMNCPVTTTTDANSADETPGQTAIQHEDTSDLPNSKR